LDISHLGIISAILEGLGTNERFNKTFMRLLAEKNAHSILALCEEYGLKKEQTEKLVALVRTYGDMRTVLEKIAPFCTTGNAKEAYAELCVVCDLLAKTPFADKIRLDFSVVNDMEYYNGFVFKGFVEGVSEGVLSGGQYDRLTARMGKRTGAIGFALYLDLLEGFGESKSGFDIDLAVLYDETTDVEVLAKTIEDAVRAGKRVSALRKLGDIRAKEILDLTGGEV
jgi:ATP phosphoribosyltransferase regulatory subunit